MGLATKRLPPGKRREAIVRQATEFFAEHGFEATTRELARHLGVTQPLMYKFFKTKQELVDEVYNSVFLNIWKDNHFDEMLTDRARPIEDRLIDFYIQYTDAIMNREWMRIYLFAGLKGVGITSSYIQLLEDRIIRRVALEICASKGITLTRENERTFVELAWSLQGGIFYFGVRRHAYGLDTPTDKNDIIRGAVKLHLKGWPTEQT